MIITAIVCCHLVGVPFGLDDVTIDEVALFRAVTREHEARSNHEVEWREKCEAIRAAGGYSAAAANMYVEWLTQEFPPYNWTVLDHVLVFLRRTNGDRSAFRPPAVKLLTHEHEAVSTRAVELLREIGTADDAAALAALLDRETRDVAYLHSVVETLAAIGTEKEVEAMEAARKAGLKRDHPRFWAKVDECEKAIRERAAKRKEKDPKATPPPEKK